jgi:hypothetical protein
MDTSAFSPESKKRVNPPVEAASCRDMRLPGHLISRLEAAPTGNPKIEFINECTAATPS